MTPSVRRHWHALGPGPAPLAALLVATGTALYLLFLLVSWYQRGGMTETEEWLVFVQGWVLIPPAALAATALLQHRIGRRGGDRAHGLWVLACTSAAALLGSIVALRIAVPGTSLAVARVVACLALPTLLLVQLVRLPRGSRRRAQAGGRDEAIVHGTLVLWAVILLLVTLAERPTLTFGSLALAAAVGLMLLAARRPRAPSPRWSWLADLGVVAVLPLLAIDPRLPFNIVHYNWVLGPVNAVMHGRTILVDAFSPYGVLLIEFLAHVLGTPPFAMGYEGLALLVAASIVVQLVVVYALLRFLLESQAAAIVGVLAALAINALGQVGEYPSSGPLRFGLPWLLPLLVLMRDRLPATTLATRAGEGIVLAVASLWETQTFLTALAAWVGVLAGDAAFASRLGRGWLATLIRRALWGIVCVVVAHVAFALVARERGGMWPDWGHFLVLVRSFSPAGEGWSLFPAPPWGGWVLMVATYLVSLFACVHAVPLLVGRRAGARLAVVLAVTLMGIAQLSYFVGLSVPIRQYSIALPALVVAAFWCERLLRGPALHHVPRVRHTVAGCMLLATALVVGPLVAPLRAALRATTLAALAGLGPETTEPSTGCAPLLEDCSAQPPRETSTAPALALIARYAPGTGRLGVFLDSSATTEVLVRSGRAHVFPLTDAIADSISTSNMEWIAGAATGLRAGDVIFASQWLLKHQLPPDNHDRLEGTPLVQRLLQRVCAEFVCTIVAQERRVVALRLNQGPAEAAP